MLIPRRIAIAASGIRYSSNYLVSSNSQYFMYGSRFCLYVYKIPEMELCETISQGLDEFRITRLNPKQTDIAFTLNKSSKMFFINIKTHHYAGYAGKIDYPINDINYSESGDKLVISYADFSIFQIMDLEKNTVNTVMGNGTPTRIFSFVPGRPDIILFGGTNNDLYTMNLETGATKPEKIITKPYCIKFDPLNPTNCLIITKKRKWAYITYTDEVQLISYCSRDDIRMLAGDWIPAMPGHIITGDRDHGIVYVWAVASGKMVFSQQIGDGGVTNITAVSQKDFVICFGDGAIGVYDVTQKLFTLKVPKAHIDTIFSGSFLPSDPSIFATAGGDGRVCFWKMPTLTQQPGLSFTAEDSQLISLAFSDGGSYIATGSIKGVLKIHNIKTNQLLFDKQIHKSAIVSIQWNPKNPNLIACSSSDKFAHIIDLTTKAISVKISVKNEFRKLQWSPKNEALAIACGDGSLYVRLDGGTYFIIKGSNMPLYDVAWSPTDENLVASTDDGGNIILFDVKSKTTKVAKAHMAKARPIVWSPVKENLLISGGNDGTICFCDAKTMSIYRQVKVHAANIYSISIHPKYPSLIVTASKDCTVRLFSIDQMFPEEKLKCLLNNETFVGAKYSQTNGSEALEKLIHRISQDGIKIAFKENDLIHVRDLLRISRKRMRQQIQTLPEDQSQIVRIRKLHQAALDAADLALKSGHLKKYCELMFICGEFDLSLAIAPSVSFDFWQSLLMARERMVETPEEAEELLLIAGKPRDAIDHMINNELYESALLVTASLRERRYKPKTKTVHVKKSPVDEMSSIPFIKDDFQSEDYELYSIASKRSMRFALEGQPLISAASLLTVGDVDGAIWRLVHSGEIVWAVDLARATGRFNKYDKITELFFRYCAYNGKGQEAFQLLPNYLKINLMPLLVFPSDSEMNTFYVQNGMKSILEYTNQSKKGTQYSQIQSKMLSGRFDEAIQSIIEILKKIMSDTVFDFNEANKYVDLIRNCASHVDSSKLYWLVAVGLCHYFGLYYAFWHGYGMVAPALFWAFKQIAEATNEEWLLKRIEEASICAGVILSKSNLEKTKEFMNAYNLVDNQEVNAALNVRTNSQNVDGGCTVKSSDPGVNPTDLDFEPMISLCSNELVTGSPFILEDLKSRMTYDEALMFFESSPFSPLRTSRYTIPY